MKNKQALKENNKEIGTSEFVAWYAWPDDLFTIWVEGLGACNDMSFHYK